MFNGKGEKVNPSAQQQEPVPEKPEVHQEQKEDVAAKNVERPRFHR